MKTHTPGPWRAGKASDQVVADVPIEAGPGGSDSVDYYGGYLVAESVAPCNGPLIAAAPELLACCHHFLAALETRPGGYLEMLLARTREAVAKAEGAAA
jgi:hypothetical protein